MGGLGLGYTACAVLGCSRHSVTVVETLGAVIDWHRTRPLTVGQELTSDTAITLVEGDFFAAIAKHGGFDRRDLNVSCDPVDIDHSPSHLLHPSHASFYEANGLVRVGDRLHPGGVFGLWSDGAAIDLFTAALDSSFASCTVHTVTFPNPLIDTESSSTVYVATLPRVADAADTRPKTSGVLEDVHVFDDDEPFCDEFV